MINDDKRQPKQTTTQARAGLHELA